jgi:hypothetical protein
MNFLNSFIWFIYLVLVPFQYFEPGSVQIADFFLIFAILINYKQIFTLLYKNVFLEWKLFIIYAFILSLFYFYIYNDFAFLKSPINYLYCYLTVLLILVFYKNFNFVNVTILSIFSSAIIQCFLFFTKDHTEDFRIALYFNNPNQLAFYGVILNTLLFVLQPLLQIKYKKYFVFLIYLLNTFLIILSISQAGIIISLLFLLFSAIRLIKKNILYFVSLIVFLFSISTYLIKVNSEFIPLVNMTTRIGNEVDEGTSGDNGLEGRNYDRIIKFPKYLFFGAGEAKFTRFNKNVNLEIHSALANILFSYGIIGFILFLMILFKVFLTLNFNNLFYFTFFMLFTVPHNMLRWPLFWITIIIFYHFKEIKHEAFKTNIT